MKKHNIMIVSAKLFLFLVVIAKPLGLDAKCKPIDYNKCTSNEQCCSGFCYIEPGWSGVCKKKINSGPMNNPVDDVFERGVCTFYGGNRTWTTANGEQYDGNEMVAAHRSLPFDTMVKVDIMGNSVTVRINDRRRAAVGQILELSAHAAEAMDISPGDGPISCQITITTDELTCKANYGFACVNHHECCSRHCYREMFAEKGVCT